VPEATPGDTRVPRHFDTRALQLKIDDAGAQFWSVALEQTQLTYFEVGPHCRFESHSHRSEQITLVLEGELYFETAAGTSRVTAGEVMAIPAEVDHAVYTKEVAARAVDAWSPINEKYHAAR
jgi:quercetin dioxygenase-like cupin family protein